jgi:hypothetical protein
MTVIKNILTVVFICSLFSMVLIDYLRDFVELVTKKKQAEIGTVIALGVRLAILLFIVLFSIEFVRLILLRN